MPLHATAQVGCSLLLVIYESVRPQMSVLWRLPSTPIYRNIKQVRDLPTSPAILPTPSHTLSRRVHNT